MFTDGYLFLVLAGLPLVIHNGYFDITGTKTLYFVLLSALYLVILSLSWLLNEKRLAVSAPNRAETAALIFAALALLSTVFCGNIRESFIGRSGRFQGGGMMLLYTLVFIAVRRNIKDFKWALRGLSVGVILSGALAICNAAGWDVFSLSTHLTDFDKGRYISTVGNINFLAAYCVLAVPVCVLAAWKRKSVLAAASAVIGFAAAVCSASFSAVLGLVSAALLAPFFLGGENFPRRSYKRILGAALLICAVCVLLLNTAWISIPLGKFENLLHFSPEWGTDRGKEWTHCWNMFISLSWWQKLLGGGCGIVARLDAQHRLFPDAVLNAAHNEYLQILLQWGILGLASFTAWLWFSLKEARKILEGNAFCLGAAAYLIQAVVNIAQTPAAPMFVIILALSTAGCYNQEKKTLKNRRVSK